MRNAFIAALTEVARAEPRIYLLAGDVGFSVFESFRDEFPERFLNMGVAEQNMAGVAAGLARAGKIPFIYSIANFPTLRCIEQIRVDICYPNLPVTVVAVGGGLAYGPMGSTHHGTEDIAILRALPNMQVVAPADAYESQRATHALATSGRPGYLRLSKTGEPEVHDDEPPFELGRAIRLLDGDAVTLIATGAIAHEALEAGRRLRDRGIAARVLSMHTVKPLDREAIRAAVLETRAILTVEEHSITGGLGSAVAEELAEMGVGIPFRRIALPDAFIPEVGSQRYLRELYGLGRERIAQEAESLLATGLATESRLKRTG